MRERLTRSCYLAATLLWIVAKLGAAGPPPEFVLEKSEDSPRREMLIQHFTRQNSDGTHDTQIWLTSTANKAQTDLLFEHTRGADIVMSRDDLRVAVNHHEASTDADVIVYERVKGTKFREIVHRDIVREKALEAFRHAHALREHEVIDHLYADCVAWAADSSSFLVRLYGHMSGEFAIRDWFCVFRVADQSITLDLRALNEHSFERPAPDE